MVYTKGVCLSSTLLALFCSGMSTQSEGGNSPEESTGELTTPEGVRLLHNRSFDDSEKARQEILDLYEHLRVTDVCDGMDLIGLQDIGLMDNEIRPLWRDEENFTSLPISFYKV